MILDKNTAKKTADLLLEIKAIKLQPNDPFTWASGWKSPIYCDNRTTLSHVELRNYLSEQMAEQIKSQFGRPEVIAGVATGAIAIGILVAEKLGVPFVYVRPEPKKHGRQNQIEGSLVPGQKVVVVEDLISTGKSSLNAVRALEEGGALIQGMMAIFSYGFDFAKMNFEKAAVELITLSDYAHLLEQAVDTDYISETELKMLHLWRESPSTWQN